MIEVFRALKQGDLVCQRSPNNCGYRIGTVVSNYIFDASEVGAKYIKILWITSDNYPVSVNDFYEEYSSIYNKQIYHLRCVDDIPEDFSDTN